MCLRESHRTRTVFRKVGGFVYVMSVLVSMEGCLRGEPVSPWNEIPVSQVLNLLHMVFNTVTVAMRFEPANAKFFHQEVSVVLSLKWKHKQLNPQPRFFVQGFQNVISFCRLILVASMLLTGLVLYYISLGWFISNDNEIFNCRSWVAAQITFQLLVSAQAFHPESSYESFELFMLGGSFQQP